MIFPYHILESVLKAGLTWLSRQRLPKTDGSLSISGLDMPAEVIRDRWGVPHIYALNRHDLYFAQGFVHAQDRLWQMEFMRRLSAGRLAEVLGAKAVAADRWFRTLGMRRVVEQEVAMIRDEVRQELEAYAAGVNARIARGRWPVEFLLTRHEPQPWTVADSLSWIKMMSWGLSIYWGSKLMRVQMIDQLGWHLTAELEAHGREHWLRTLPSNVDGSPLGASALHQYDKVQPFVSPSPHPGLGSNNWVIAGSRTASGAPIVANDMHLTMDIPCMWYENHLVCGDFNVTGVTLAGLPGVTVGHNGQVAWGLTSGIPDGQDLYIECLRHTEDGRVQYAYQGQWLEARVIPEPIQVRGGEDLVEEVIVTHHGPIINDVAADLVDERPLALRWVSLQPDTMVEVIHDMNHARDNAAFWKAMRQWTAPYQNVVCADQHGDIAYRLVGRVPIRAHENGLTPVPGWTGAYEWTGYVPFEELPHLDNPPQGYVATANNLVVDDGKHYLGYEYHLKDRVQRIQALIEEREAIDAAYAKQMQFDQVSPMSRVVAGYVGQLAVDDAELAAVVALFQDWDGVMAVDSAAAAVYQVFVRRLIHLILSGKLEALAPVYAGKGVMPVVAERHLFGDLVWLWLQNTLSDPRSHWFDLGDGQTRDDVMRLALRQAVDYLNETLGPHIEDWQWGKLHQLSYRHLLGSVRPLDRVFNLGPYPVGGDHSTVCVSSTDYYDLECDTVIGATFRFVGDVGDLSHAQAMLVPGQSGQVGSPHYADQVAAWFEGHYHPMLYRREDVVAAAEGRLHLTPEQDFEAWLFRIVTRYRRSQEDDGAASL